MPRVQRRVHTDLGIESGRLFVGLVEGRIEERHFVGNASAGLRASAEHLPANEDCCQPYRYQNRHREGQQSGPLALGDEVPEWKKESEGKEACTHCERAVGR